MISRFGYLMILLGLFIFFIHPSLCVAQKTVIEIKFDYRTENLNNQNRKKLDKVISIFSNLPLGTRIRYSASPGGGSGDSIKEKVLIERQWNRVSNAINYLEQKGIKRSLIIFGSGCFMSRDIHEIEIMVPNYLTKPPPFPVLNSHIDTLEFAENEINLDCIKMLVLDKYYRLSHRLSKNQMIVITDLVGVSCGETKQNSYQWSRTENCVKYLEARGVKPKKLVWQSAGLGLTGLTYVLEIRIKEIEITPYSPPFPNLKRQY